MYADEIWANGDEKRAEFIQLQIALERGDPKDPMRPEMVAQKERVAPVTWGSVSRRPPIPFARWGAGGEAHLVAIACSQTPEGHARWTMDLLAERLVELKVIDSIHPSAVCRALKKCTQAGARPAVGHPTEKHRRVRRSDGRRDRGVPQAIRAEVSGGVRG